jgi:predicted RNA-binding Zn-ribbon protein involved in translation (DUF1610 family)
MMVGSSGMTGGGGVKERKIRVSCPNCGETKEEYIQVIEHKKETVCPACGHKFLVVR